MGKGKQAGNVERSGATALTVEAGAAERSYLTPWEVKLQARTEKLLLTWGGYESVRRFMRKISKVSTRFAFLHMVNQYFLWL